MRLILTIAGVVSLCAAQPVIDAAVNSANFAGRGQINSGLAQGSILAIFGRGLGPEGLALANGFPYSGDLAGVSVQIAVGGTTVNALMLYVTAAQIGAVVPSATPLGPGTVTVTFQGKTSAPAPVTIVRRNFGAFTQSQSGYGPAIAQNYEAAGNEPLNTLVRPARAGQVITIWGTGLGPVSGDESAQPLPGNQNIPVKVFFGTQPARVVYAGRSGCCIGVDQIIVETPAGVEGCYVPLAIVAGELYNDNVIPVEGTINDSATVAVVKEDGACSDPTGLSGSELQSMVSRGSLRLGAVALRSFADERSAPSAARLEAQFSATDATGALRAAGVAGLPAPGTCLEVPVNRRLLGTALDAGASLTISGPNLNGTVTPASAGSYSDRLGSMPGGGLNGAYTVQNGAGTAAVGPFSFVISAPPPVTWTNRSVQLGHSSHTFRWSGGTPGSYVVMDVTLANTATAIRQICIAPAEAGAYTVGSPYYDIGVLGREFGRQQVQIELGTMSPVTRFSAAGLDVGIAYSINSEARTY